MNAGHTRPSTALPEYLNPLDPSTNLYYNTRMHKLQYHYGPALEAQYENRNVPPLEITALYEGQQVASNWRFVSSRTDDEWWKAAAESEDEKSNTKARKDSANDIDFVKVEKELSNDFVQNNHQGPAEQLQTYSNVCLDLRLKSNISSLSHIFPSLLSTADTFNQPKRIENHHNVIACADIEELAEARPATTTFTANGDGSISIACSFSPNSSIGCACRIESALASLFGKETTEPEHMAVKRRMWWRLSSHPIRPQAMFRAYQSPIRRSE